MRSILLINNWHEKVRIFNVILCNMILIILPNKIIKFKKYFIRLPQTQLYNDPSIINKHL
jgi:hypothetical protein